MNEELEEFVDSAQLGIIEDQIKRFEEEYRRLQRKGEKLERQKELENQIDIWKEALNQARSEEV